MLCLRAVSLARGKQALAISPPPHEMGDQGPQGQEAVS